jgi:hypothetical protein
MSTVSDNAVFFADLVEQGCGWHLAKGRLFLCRRKDDLTWENTLIYQMTNFPEREVPEGEASSSVTTRLWVEPEQWESHDLPPNVPQEQGSQIFGVMASATRFHGRNEEEKDKLWQMLLERCRGKTYRQVMGK